MCQGAYTYSRGICSRFQCSRMIRNFHCSRNGLDSRLFATGIVWIIGESSRILSFIFIKLQGCLFIDNLDGGKPGRTSCLNTVLKYFGNIDITPNPLVIKYSIACTVLFILFGAWKNRVDPVTVCGCNVFYGHIICTIKKNMRLFNYLYLDYELLCQGTQ